MAHGCFTDRTDQPDSGRAEAVLGAARPLWDELIGDLEARSTVRVAWRFYGRNHGWALACRRHGRAIAALFPDEGALTVLVVLSGEQADAALADERLSAATRQRIAALPRFKEGCWVFLRVAAESQLGDARRLIGIRAGCPTDAGSTEERDAGDRR